MEGGGGGGGLTPIRSAEKGGGGGGGCKTEAPPPPQIKNMSLSYHENHFLPQLCVTQESWSKTNTSQARSSL